MLDINRYELNGDFSRTSGNGTGHVILNQIATPQFHTGGTFGGVSVSPYSGSACLIVPPDRQFSGGVSPYSSTNTGPWTIEYKWFQAGSGGAGGNNDFALIAGAYTAESGLIYQKGQGPYYMVNGVWTQSQNGYPQEYNGIIAETGNQWNRAVVQLVSGGAQIALYLGANILGQTPSYSAFYRMNNNLASDISQLAVSIGSSVMYEEITGANLLIDDIRITSGFWQGSVLDPTGNGGISQKTTSNAWAIGTPASTPPSSVSADSYWGLDLEGSIT